MDWRSVFVHQGHDRGLPAPMSRLAAWTVQRRIDIDLDRFDWVPRSAELRLPMLVFAPDGDTYVPNGPALAVAAARPDLVELVDDPRADHVRTWNVDPEAYQARLRAWLTRLDVTRPVSAAAR
jgi:hypothetical protein